MEAQAVYTRTNSSDLCPPYITLRTLDRLLRQHNIKKWLARLKTEHAKSRLQWAPAHKDWTEEDFERVIYSDECSVEQQPAGQQRWIFSTLG